MRIALIAAAAGIALVAGCRGPGASQANNGDANMSAEHRPDATAEASAVIPIPTAPASKEQAAAVMHERHEDMEKLGKMTKAIGRELKAGSPDLATIRASAATIADIAPKVPPLFPPGTGPEVGKTGAKPEIWHNPQDFAAKAHALNEAAIAFKAAADGGDLGAIKARFADLGKSCKACHDKYRKEMKH